MVGYNILVHCRGTSGTPKTVYGKRAPAALLFMRCHFTRLQTQFKPSIVSTCNSDYKLPRCKQQKKHPVFAILHCPRRPQVPRASYAPPHLQCHIKILFIPPYGDPWFPNLLTGPPILRLTLLLLGMHDYLGSRSRSAALHSSSSSAQKAPLHPRILEHRYFSLILLIKHQYCSSNFKNPSFRRSRRSSSNSPLPRRLQTM